MELFGAILSIAIALTLGAMTPGPSFLMVARTAVAVSRRDGLAAAAGMGAGGALFSVLALVGLLAILAAIPVLYVVLKLSGGTYLVYLAYRIWRSADQPLVADNAPVPSCVAHPWKSFWLGLATQASNPKTALVYASVFASLLPAKVPSFVPVVLPVLIFSIETIWYSVVAIMLSAPAPRARYVASKAWLDRSAGAIMALLGIKLIVEAR